MSSKIAEHNHPSLTESSVVSWRPKNMASVLVWSLGLVLAFAGGAWWTMRRSESHDRIALPAAIETSSKGIVITTGEVTVRPIERSISAVGSLNGFEEIALSTKLEGRVLKIHSDVSTVVKPGDTLLEIDPTDAKLAVSQAKRSLESELAKWGFAEVPHESTDLQTIPLVVSARLKYELAQSRLNRLIPLHKSMAITDEEFDQASSDVRVQEAEWKNQVLLANAAAANARLKQADLEIALQRLSDCKIVVPMPTLADDASEPIYTVSDRMVSEGMMLRPGTEVFKLVLGRTLKLKLPVPEKYSAEVAVGQTVEVVSNSVEEPVQGKVARISPSIDRQTRTVLVEVELSNAGGRLRPGGFAKAEIIVGTDSSTATIPLSSLFSFAGINKIFTIDQGIAKEVKVVIGQQSQDWVEIISPSLSAGTVVATSGQRLLFDGVEVTLRSDSRQEEKPVASNVEVAR